jgi:hypothetical protein
MRETFLCEDWGNILEAVTFVPLSHFPDTYLRVISKGINPFPFSSTDGHVEDHAEVSAISPMAGFEGRTGEGTFP